MYHKKDRNNPVLRQHHLYGFFGYPYRMQKSHFTNSSPSANILLPFCDLYDPYDLLIQENIVAQDLPVIMQVTEEPL